MHADNYQTTIKRTYGYARLESTYDGDLRSSIENERNFTVPSLTVIEPYVPTALESLKPSESNCGPVFGFCNANPIPKKLNLRDLILLDNRSTVDIFCNKRLLKDIHVSDEDVTVHGNGGSLTTNK